MSIKACSNHKRIFSNGQWKGVKTGKAWNFYKVDVGIEESTCDLCATARVCPKCDKLLGCYQNNKRNNCHTCFFETCLIVEGSAKSDGLCRSCGEVVFQEIRRRRNGEG